MAAKDFKAAYRNIMDDPFPDTLEISFGSGKDRQILFYEKTQWTIDEEKRGLRYGENPGQPAALYKLINGNLHLGEVSSLEPGRFLASDVELLQSGKHPGKINITDVDAALNILRYFTDVPCTVIVKHNNPCGVAKGKSLSDSYYRANMADRIAAFGGAIAVNREMDRETAQLIVENYSEVVVAPEYADGVLDLLKKKKNLRIMRIQNMNRLVQYIGERTVDFKSLLDGGLVVQWSYAPQVLSKGDFHPAVIVHKGREYRIQREPTDREYEDLLFGWLVESGVTSNSVIYVKDGVTVGIGTGEQDRVGVAEIARDKAYRRMADRICWKRTGKSYYELTDEEMKKDIEEGVRKEKGGIEDSCMISDAFFPKRDGIEVGLREGVSAICQPGGSLNDHEGIEACNEAGAAMVFTGERSFRH